MGDEGGGAALPPVVFQEVEEKARQGILEKLATYWKTLTPETRASIRQVEFVSDRYAEKNLGWDALKDGEGLPGGYMVFRANERFHFRVFRHEAAHERHYEIRREEASQALNGQGAEELRKIMKENPDRAAELQKRYMRVLHWSPFEEAWKAIAGDVYGKVSFFRRDGFWMWREFEGMTPEAVNRVINQKGKRFVYGPRHGCIRPYGCSSLLEDVAAFTDKIDEPSYYGPLLDPENPEFDERYVKKLKLFCKYRFISEAEYGRVLQAAGR